LTGQGFLRCPHAHVRVAVTDYRRRMNRIRVPYHIDEYLPDLDLPLAPDVTVAAELPDGDAWSRVAAVQLCTRDAVEDSVRRGERPVVVAGDCMASLGTLAGLQRAGLDPGIVWLDAHGDVQTLETTASGYLGGLPLRIAVGYRPELIATRLGLRPVPEHRALLVGARDLDPPEVDYLRQAEIRQFTTAELTAAVLPDGPLYLHVDLDVIDPDEVPRLRFPAPSGPTLADVTETLRRVIATGRVAAICLACTWYPDSAAAQRIGSRLEAALAAW
jgi:arginase